MELRELARLGLPACLFPIRPRLRAGLAHSRAGLLGFYLTDDPRHVVWQVAGEAIRLVTRQEFVEHHAQGVDVARRSDGLAAELLGTGVGQRHPLLSGPHGDARLRHQCRVEELGDPEVEQFGHAIRRDEDIAGFEIAVHDQVLVGIVDGGADGPKERQPRGDGQRMAGAVDIEREPLDVVHDQVGEAVCSRAPVQEFGNVRVIKAGEDLPLGAKAPQEVAGWQAWRDELDGHLLVVVVVGPHGEVDHAHASGAELAHDLVGTNLSSDDGLGRRVCLPGLCPHKRWGLDEAAGMLVRRQERFDLVLECHIARTGVGEKLSALAGTMLQGGVKQHFHLLPLLRCHGPLLGGEPGTARPWPGSTHA